MREETNYVDTNPAEDKRESVPQEKSVSFLDRLRGLVATFGKVNLDRLTDRLAPQYDPSRRKFVSRLTVAATGAAVAGADLLLSPTKVNAAPETQANPELLQLQEQLLSEIRAALTQIVVPVEGERTPEGNLRPTEDILNVGGLVYKQIGEVPFDLGKGFRETFFDSTGEDTVEFITSWFEGFDRTGGFVKPINGGEIRVSIQMNAYYDWLRKGFPVPGDVVQIATKLHEVRALRMRPDGQAILEALRVSTNQSPVLARVLENDETLLPLPTIFNPDGKTAEEMMILPPAKVFA